MIRPIELRIGNYVKLGSIVLDVTEIQKDCFYANDSENQSFKNTWAEIEPIPLTKEMLLKCNMKKHSPSNFECIDSGFDLYCAYDIKYLHQLQNIYFCIVGKELNINL